MNFEKYIDKDILEKFEFYNYGHALEILHDAFQTEWAELQDCLRQLQLTLADIKKREEMSHQYRRNSMMFYTHMAGEKYGSVVI